MSHFHLCVFHFILDLLSDTSCSGRLHVVERVLSRSPFSHFLWQQLVSDTEPIVQPVTLQSSNAHASPSLIG